MVSMVVWYLASSIIGLGMTILATIGEGMYGNWLTGLQSGCKVTTMALPLTWGDCKWVPRPCPYTTCRHNNGKRVYNSTNCSLDLAEQGPMSERQIAKALGISVKQVREVLTVGLARVKDAIEAENNDNGNE